MKITFIGAGSTVFTRNLIGDCLYVPELKDSEFALYDIDGERLEQSKQIATAILKTMNSNGKVTTFLGVEKRKEALKNSTFVINTIQVGGYNPSTIIDFEIPKKYGLQQTIGDTLGIGGIMRALRTIPVVNDIAEEMEEVCPDAFFLNYSNPMAMISGYLQTYTKIKTVGLCHSVQVCVKNLFDSLGMNEKIDGHKELIAGINHMAWLLEIKDKEGKDLYPEIKSKIQEHLNKESFWDKVRYDYIKNFGYYCTESSEHNAEYNNFYIKRNYPELIQKYNIPLDEYPRRCIKQINEWKECYQNVLNNVEKPQERSREYGSHIMEAITTGRVTKIAGNVLNTEGVIANLPREACVEVPCLVDAYGIHPCSIGKLPVQCAAMNRTNINVQLLAIEAAKTKKIDYIYQAAMLDPHTSSELDIDTIKKMVDELINAHGEYLPKYN